MVTGPHVRDSCRLCSSPKLEPVLSLTPTPPANELLGDRASSLSQDAYGLGLSECGACGHVQLLTVVDPSRLFGDYVYLTGSSPGLVLHFKATAAHLSDRLSLKPGAFIVEVGSNDGTLLGFFKDRGMRVLGIDPAIETARAATEAGVRTVPGFLTPTMAEAVTAEEGRAHLVVANNVFAHVDDLASMADAVREIMHPFGVFVFEVQYLVDLVDKGLFDMIYHEHLSYHHVGPLIPFFAGLGMSLFDVERIGTHGGSIRCYVDFGDRRPTGRVRELRELEASMGLRAPGIPPRSSDHALRRLSDKIGKAREDLLSVLQSVDYAGGERVAGYGAPAKATTLIHHFGLQEFLQFVVDDNPLKQDKFIPGTDIPILSSAALDHMAPDHLLILAWNYADDIMRKCEDFHRRGGRFIVPFPEVREI